MALDSCINKLLKFEGQRANNRGDQTFTGSLVCVAQATQGLWDPLLSDFTSVLTVPRILMLQVKAFVTVAPSVIFQQNPLPRYKRSGGVFLPSHFPCIIQMKSNNTYALMNFDPPSEPLLAHKEHSGNSSIVDLVFFL